MTIEDSTFYENLPILIGPNQVNLLERLYGSQEGADSLEEREREASSRLPARSILPISQSTVYGLSFVPLVGSGESKLGCGSFFTVGCLNAESHKGMTLDGVNMDGKGYFERHKRSCHNPLCPICWESWASRETKKAKKRLDAFHLKGRSLKPIHVTVSVPREDYDKSLLVLRSKCYKALKSVHFLGGMGIFHPRRKNSQGLWYYSPHFHALGYGWLTDVKKQYIASGWIVKNIGIRKTVEGTIWYQLSHAGVPEGRHVATWFGVCSYNKLKLAKEEKEAHVCPVCGDPLKQVFWVGSQEMDLPDVDGFVFWDDPSNWQERSIFREFTV